jgi:hypothetical protein
MTVKNGADQESGIGIQFAVGAETAPIDLLIVSKLLQREDSRRGDTHLFRLDYDRAPEVYLGLRLFP